MQARLHRLARRLRENRCGGGLLRPQLRRGYQASENAGRETLIRETFVSINNLLENPTKPVSSVTKPKYASLINS